MFLRVWERLKKHSVTLTRPHKRSKFERYFIPLVLIISVVLMKFLLRTFVSDQTSYHLLTLIIIVSAFYGGLRSGLLATFLSAIMEATVFLPRNESIFGVYNILSTLTLVIGGVYISIISDLKHRADLQKDGFIAFASHELRNPLHKINGYVQTLLKKDAKLSKKQVTETASQISKHAKQATTLIDELLDVTKIEAGKLYFTLKKYPIYDLVEGTVKEARFFTDHHTIQLEGKTTKKVYGDKFRLEQVLSNLIANAVKYSPDSDRVLVKIENSGNEVVISVQDFGKGIAEKNLNRIFEPYFRGNPTSQDITPGLGLGLYISSEIIRRHKGKMSVTSTEGKGSTFIISLPTV